MVHALNEIWRVLSPGGYLIDLRPFVKNWPVEIVTDDEVKVAGMVDDTDGFPADLAANAAVEHVVERGLFIPEKTDSFELFTYWEDVAAFKTYMDQRSTGILEHGALSRATQFMAQGGTEARLRNRYQMIITRYRRRD